jgi:hypothetical protein
LQWINTKVLRRCLVAALATAFLLSAPGADPEAFAGDRLNKEYFEAADSEPELSDGDVFAAINRWTTEIYAKSPEAALAYTWACLIDPVTAEIAREWSQAMAGASTVEGKVAAIDAWNEKNMCHTQMLDLFKDRPGQDPWGIAHDGIPTYKKLLPSEMKAMRALTGKISGKCFTLANLLVAGLVHVGVDFDDLAIIHFQMPNYQHGAAMFRWDGELVRTNNNRMGMFYGEGAPPTIPPEPMLVIALYNNRFYSSGGFSVPVGCMDEGAFDGDGSLMSQIVEKCCGEADIPEADRQAEYDFSDIDGLKRAIFEGVEGGTKRKARRKEKGPQADGPMTGADATPWLAKYAYQSLYVKHPENYLRASLRESHTRGLADTLNGVDATLEWMRQNISGSSIFPDCDERLMTADQVLVFKTGAAADKGVLLWTLLKHNGLQSELVLTDETAYIHADEKWYDMKTMEKAQAPERTILTIDVDWVPEVPTGS